MAYSILSKHSCQGTKDFVNRQKIVGLPTFWTESLKFGYTWENFGRWKKLLFALTMSSSCFAKQTKFWVVQTGPKL